MGNLFDIVIAVTLASFLSHISLLLLLGRHEEVYKGIDMLTNSLASGYADAQHIHSPDVYTPRCSYPMYEDRPVQIPQAMPSHNASWGAPIDWQNPGSVDVRQQNERLKQQQQQQQRRNSGHSFTNNYYM